MGIVIDKSLCIGCGTCLGACGSGALEMTDEGFAAVNDQCVMCGMCVDACPVGAIELKKDVGDNDISAYHGIWVFAQQSEGEILPVAFELLGKGRELADSLGEALTAVCFGSNVKNPEKLIHAGADSVLLADDASLAFPMDLPYADLLTNLIHERKPAIVLYGATAFGRSMAPRVAATVGTGLTADCTILEIDEETKLLRQTRPAFGGNLMATIICPNTRPQMATVCLGVMPALEPNTARTGNIERLQIKPQQFDAVKLLNTISEITGDNIIDYDILVVAGKGVGSKENMKIVKRLAELLGGNYGVSRPLVDAGWAEYQHQIGQTGCSVSPKLLISVGVSGAIQHLSGIGGAQTVVAVNTDPDAPIFGVADYAIVGDCIEFMQEMIAQLEEK
ncbi:MAG: electron transfer flavoprotein subunit alpha [Oscillospiraceae bacterium]|nr:electron transfer flavoprotein subunit alpha [Oscillospiraceae bacterium]